MTQDEMVDCLLRLALEEDIGSGDATTRALLVPSTSARGFYRARQKGVMAGVAVLKRLWHLLDDGVVFTPILSDGSVFHAGDILAEISGTAESVLSGERVSLNLMQRMAAVAQKTRIYVEEAKKGNPKAKVYDTRKTTPGHRIIEKAAVIAGGGHNHRMGLYDMILIKDNHIALFGTPSAAVRQARSRSTLAIMVEMDTLEDLLNVLHAEVDYILLDNMNPEMISTAVQKTDQFCQENGWRRPLLEASGGISLETIADIARTGVDRISVGALTHGAGSVDIGLDFE